VAVSPAPSRSRLRLTFILCKEASNAAPMSSPPLPLPVQLDAYHHDIARRWRTSESRLSISHYGLPLTASLNIWLGRSAQNLPNNPLLRPRPTDHNHGHGHCCLTPTPPDLQSSARGSLHGFLLRL
jgi:hypothetical protein